MVSDNSFSVHVSYGSVDRSDGGDVRPSACALLSEFRVVAAIRDAIAPWEEGQEAVIEIAVTDEGKVLTLSDEDTIETTLTARALREAFDSAGMTLWLSVGDEDEDDFDDASELWEKDADADEHGEAVGSHQVELEDAALETMFDDQPVRVAAFSHRGSMIARYLAESTGSTVEYVEAGTWSLCRYATTEPTELLPPTKAEGPVIELNLVDGSADWIEVRVPGLAAVTVPFWPQGERDTQPVIDVDTITVPETKETYRRLITEGDGARDELTEIADAVPLDVDGAHRALMPESLGGVVGSRERTKAFLAAFQVPAELVDLAVDDEPANEEGLTVRTRFEPQGWVRGIGDAIVGGYAEALPLTRRDRWDARLSRKLRQDPMLATALSIGELALGLLSARTLRGGWKSIGILLVIDAVGDLIVAEVRRRRQR